jgi:hypothetical protein
MLADPKKPGIWWIAPTRRSPQTAYSWLILSTQA